MVGPSLMQMDAHREIHEAVALELREATEALREALRTGREQLALQLAHALLTTWRTRVLAHADAEEEELYQWVLQRHPKMQEKIAALARDHALLRRMTAEASGKLKEEVTPEILAYLDALLLIQRYHSEDEEQSLSPILEGSKSAG